MHNKSTSANIIHTCGHGRRSRRTNNCSNSNNINNMYIEPLQKYLKIEIYIPAGGGGVRSSEGEAEAVTI